jgi:3-hydroxy-9,10-secoandrosta-1,3,5(10)-triene-9,17-dione monooxygenase
MRTAGFFKLMQPWRLGGLEASIRVSVEVVRLLSQLQASAGWILMAQMGHVFMLGTFAPETQDEIKNDDADTILGGGAAPTASAIPVEGGYRVSGRFVLLPVGSTIQDGPWPAHASARRKAANFPR